MMITNSRERDYDEELFELGTANFVCGHYIRRDNTRVERQGDKWNERVQNFVNLEEEIDRNDDN